MRLCKDTGGELPANLYNDQRGRSGVYRYKGIDGRFKIIRKPYDEAVELARRANARLTEKPPARRSLEHWQDGYTAWYERQNPHKAISSGWKNQRRYLRRFCERFATIPCDRITIELLSGWWDELTYDQQHNQRAALSRFFVYMMGRGAAKSNPFNTSDTEPHLMERAKPRKRRLPLHIDEFWKVYEVAPDFVRRAMLISLLTTMRRGDIAALRFDQIVDGKLCVTIGKSASQRGATRASHLRWRLSEHTALKRVVDESREASLRLMRCPYVVATRCQDKTRGKGIRHRHQVTSDMISRGFRKAVSASGLWDNIEPGRTPPSFHEVRGLAIERMLADGVDIKLVKHLAAHTDESTTSGYAANHEPEYEDVKVVSPIALRV